MFINFPANIPFYSLNIIQKHNLNTFHHLGLVVQGETLARGVFFVLNVQNIAGGQAVRFEKRPHLLCQLLRPGVCHPLRRMRRDFPRR